MHHRLRPTLLIAVLAVLAAALMAEEAAVCAGAPGTTPTGGAPTIPAVDFPAADYATIRDMVLPTPEEEAWLEIPWIPTFAEGMRRAEAEGKPLLLWGMNGHPLGCT